MTYPYESVILSDKMMQLTTEGMQSEQHVTSGHMGAGAFLVCLFTMGCGLMTAVGCLSLCVNVFSLTMISLGR